MPSSKPDRRAKQPVDLGPTDDTPAPSQHSQKSGAGGGRERARRLTERMPKAGGAEAHEKQHQGNMLDKAVDKQMSKEARQRTSGRRSAGTPPGEAAPPHAAAASAEAATTQKRTLTEEKPRRRKLRDEGVED